MKKKLFIFIAIIATLMCFMAISSSAQYATADNLLGKYDADPGVDSVTHRITAEESIDLSSYFTRTGTSNGVITDSAAKVVLYDSVTEGYYVFKSLYVIQDMNKFEYYFDDLNTAISEYAQENEIETYPQFAKGGSYGSTYSVNLVRFEIPENSVYFDSNHCKLSGNANLVSIWMSSKTTSICSHIFASNPKLEYVYNFESLNISSAQTMNNPFENSYSMKEIKFPPNTEITIGNDGLGQIWGSDANGNSYLTLAQSRTFTIYINDNFSCGSNIFKVNGSAGKIEFVYCGNDYETFLENNTALASATVVSKDDYTVGSFANAMTFVCDYSICDGYYNGEHTGIDADCSTSDECEVCGLLVEAHKPQSLIIKYTDYTENGTKTVVCKVEGCNGTGTFDADPLFEAPGYSIKKSGSSYGILSTYVINVKALEEYESQDGKVLQIGIFLANANHFTGNFVNADATLNNDYGFISDIKARDYNRINCVITDFTANEADLELVMSLYVIDDGNVSYIQSEREGGYVGTVERDSILDTVTIRKIAELDTTVEVPEAIIPKKDEE